jgi:hypothetical protein
LAGIVVELMSRGMKELLEVAAWLIVAQKLNETPSSAASHAYGRRT